jgi:thiamine-phosphate pyrophosphorylase
LAVQIRAAALPSVGIGGINAGNAGSVVRAGADGVAVISAIQGAADPRKATEALALEVQRAKAAR